MGDAKQIIVKPISSQDANKIVRALHYSGKVVNNSQLHLGAFLDGRCGGALQFGPSLDKRKMQGLVSGTLWNEFLELNRMAFADWLPRNSESRCIAYAMRFIKKTYPWIKWVVSFADGTQCGDGTIYRASGFVLTDVKVNSDLYKTGDGVIIHSLCTKSSVMKKILKKYGGMTGGQIRKAMNCALLPGFQLRYIYFIDPTARERLTVPILPFSEIERRGAGMYKGVPKARPESDTSDTTPAQGVEGGSRPTSGLQCLSKE